MAIARCRDHIARCGIEPPMVVQQYVNHGGVLWKVNSLLLLLPACA
jgi:hypothetical protein